MTGIFRLNGPSPVMDLECPHYDEVGLERCVPMCESAVVMRRTHRVCSAPNLPRPQSLQSEPVEVVQFASSDAMDVDLVEETLNKFSHRFAWLVALLLLQSLSSFILKQFEPVFLKHSIIILFLTMLVGAGGNAGSQSAVLAIRGIAKGSFAPHSSMRAFVFHELFTGLKLAFILAAVSLLRVWVFDGALWEVLAICVSMFGIVFVAVLVGTLMPLCLWRCGFDAAHAGAAIQVTIDILGVTMTCVFSSLIFGIAARAFDMPTMATSDAVALLPATS
eukprot:Protomagalhaensia_wolfi_Nauph_80__2421@NODE_25_length_4703_cov_54_878859_g20_i0_p2_GENE_NODE_25_length_4703_cov_54_878859_g20_i0NODE_25_length_4703_cov_54_878859_g20_i0_p2_ORF_typecomplete_len277_score44_47MgtE/PF01769_16/1_7e03MgtE/PF01769_16/1_3e10_NODE_25_length_4703_cov_54_878859_g20_i020742904